MFTGGLAAIGVLAVVGMLTGLSIGLKLRAAAKIQHSCPPGYSKDNVDVTFFVVRLRTGNKKVSSEKVKFHSRWCALAAYCVRALRQTRFATNVSSTGLGHSRGPSQDVSPPSILGPYTCRVCIIPVCMICAGAEACDTGLCVPRWYQMKSGSCWN